MRLRLRLLALAAASLLAACPKAADAPDAGLAGLDAGPEGPALPSIDFGKLEDGTGWSYSETRPQCASRTPTRRALFGDLHAHTGFSFDAWAYGNRATPADLYRYAKGEAVPFEGGPRTVQLSRPLDFAAVSDHIEFIGEIALCTEPGHAAYDSDICKLYRSEPEQGTVRFGVECTETVPVRVPICEGEADCVEHARARRWGAIRQAAEGADDKTAACGFTAFVGYEYTATPGIDNLHRLVLFRNAKVPEVPLSHYEAPTAWHLWAGLMQSCLLDLPGCDVMTEAHNTNLASGAMFAPEPAGSRTKEERAYRARARGYLEPLFEIFQNKGASECREGLGATSGDAACGFEQVWPDGATDCGERVGTLGMRLRGCTSKYDYGRGILLEGLRMREELGVNPYRMAFMATTDTHNATVGRTEEHDFEGHIGIVDDTAQKRFSPGNLTHDTYITNPGGLTGVWAEENSRDAIFSAMRRRETFATSGTRIQVRFFGGFQYASDFSPADGWEARAYADGVPMGGVLPAAPAGKAPVFVIRASADPGTAATPGNALEEIQVVKGWRGADGAVHEKVETVARSAKAGAGFDDTKCGANQNGDASFFQIWTDPAFDPTVPAFYYVRVLEAPTCRWSSWDCLRTTGADRPVQCDEAGRLKTVQERAWTSPIWYEP
ncbi:MAG TPA: DUF3604 domain-containing protein [Myxococcales bacterium]|jgi:hypothetical protein